MLPDIRDRAGALYAKMRALRQLELTAAKPARAAMAAAVKAANTAKDQLSAALRPCAKERLGPFLLARAVTQAQVDAAHGNSLSHGCCGEMASAVDRLCQLLEANACLARLPELRRDNSCAGNEAACICTCPGPASTASTVRRHAPDCTGCVREGPLHRDTTDASFPLHTVKAALLYGEALRREHSFDGSELLREADDGSISYSPLTALELELRGSTSGNPDVQTCGNGHTRRSTLVLTDGVQDRRTGAPDGVGAPPASPEAPLFLLMRVPSKNIAGGQGQQAAGEEDQLPSGDDATLRVAENIRWGVDTATPATRTASRSIARSAVPDFGARTIRIGGGAQVRYAPIAVLVYTTGHYTCVIRDAHDGVWRRADGTVQHPTCPTAGSSVPCAGTPSSGPVLTDDEKLRTVAVVYARETRAQMQDASTRAFAQRRALLTSVTDTWDRLSKRLRGASGSRDPRQIPTSTVVSSRSFKSAAKRIYIPPTCRRPYNGGTLLSVNPIHRRRNTRIDSLSVRPRVFHILLSDFGYEAINVRSLGTILPGEWLDDNIMDFKAGLLTDQTSDVHTVSTMWLQLLTRMVPDEKRAIHLLRPEKLGFDIFSRRFIIIPIHDVRSPLPGPKKRPTSLCAPFPQPGSVHLRRVSRTDAIHECAEQVNHWQLVTIHPASKTVAFYCSLHRENRSWVVRPRAMMGLF